MFSLRDLRFVLCSVDPDVLWCAKDHGLFYLNYPQINEFGRSYTVRQHRSVVSLLTTSLSARCFLREETRNSDKRSEN